MTQEEKERIFKQAKHQGCVYMVGHIMALGGILSFDRQGIKTVCGTKLYWKDYGKRIVGGWALSREELYDKEELKWFL